MRNVLILTIHSQNNNFGSVLQAYSLYQAVKEQGFNPTILNYQPYYSNGMVGVKQSILKIASNFLFLPYYIVRKRNFNKIFRLEKLTRKIRKYKKLRKYSQKYNIYLIGSDQVWNPNYLCGQDKAYYYDFVSNVYKVAYAASIGTEKLTETQLQNIADSLVNFQYVSLREKKSVLQLKEIGFLRAEYCLDPVFLFDKSFYRNIQSDFLEKNYILAYIIQKDPFMSEVVETISKLLKKKVIQIGGFASKCRCDKFLRTVGPLEFLSLVDNADFVITSSFHGTAFAHIYSKQFAVVLPQSNSLRVTDLLETAGTGDRVISDLSDVDKMLNKIDFDSVHEKIKIYRAKSLNYLRNALNAAGSNVNE